MIEIKRYNCPTLVSLEDYTEGSFVHYELMSDHYIKLIFTLTEPVYLKVGDYIETEFGLFCLLAPYRPKYNVETDAFDYDIQFDAYYLQFGNKLCKYLPYTTSSEAAFKLTASIETHVNVVLSNINALCDRDPSYLYNGKKYSPTFLNLPDDKADSMKYIEYNNIDIISALNKIAETFECEWWIDGSVIFFGKCETGEEVEFFLGENVESMTSTESSNEYATRLIAFGSTRNIPANYRKDESADITKDGVVERRLMLPSSLCPRGFVEDTGITEREAIEAVYVNENIFPRVKCEVSEVIPYTSSVENEDGTKSEWTFYRLKDSSGFELNTDMILEGETLHIIFKSGKLNGMDFECHYSDSDKYYEVVVNENYGRKLPDNILKPEKGDTFVLYNWDATRIEETGIIADAEKELYDDALSKLSQMKIDPNTYDCIMQSDWYSDFIERTSSLSYSIGQRVKLVNIGYFPNGRSSRIIGYEIKLDIVYDQPKYIVGEALAYSRTKNIQSQLDSLTYNGITYQNKGTGSGGGSSVYVIGLSDNTPATDYNVYSARRSDNQFVSKKKADRTPYPLNVGDTLTAERIMRIGDFIQGLYGKGIHLDDKGYGELSTLFLRKDLVAPRFIYNDVAVTKSEHWNTNGYCEIAEVDSVNHIITERLEEGEYGSLMEGDICHGIYADIENAYGSDAIIDGSVDECGFIARKGYFTSYFYVKRIIESGNGKFVFEYEKRNAATPEPCALMNAVQYGSFTNKDRQSSMYFSSRGRSYIEILEGVDTWEIQPAMRVARYGNLEGVIIHQKDGTTKDLHGNGLFVQDNVYFGSAVVQLDPETLEDLKNSLNVYTVDFSGYVDVITVDDVGNAIGGLWTQDGEYRSYRIYSAITVRNQGKPLIVADDDKDAEAGTYKIYVQPKGCSCIVENSTIYITAIDNIKDGVVGSEDDENFDYDAMRNMDSCSVDIIVDCEGKGSIVKNFPIRIKHDSQPYVGADLSNEHSGVSWNTKAQKYIGLPLVTDMKMWHNNEPLDATSIAINGVPGATLTERVKNIELNGMKIQTSLLKVNGSLIARAWISQLPEDLALITNLSITTTAVYSGISYERTLVHTINKSTDTNVYSLLPSVSEIVVSSSKELSADIVECSVVCDSSNDNHYTVSEADYSMHKIAIYYSLLRTNDIIAQEKEYTEGIKIDSGVSEVSFVLYGIGADGKVDKTVIHDKETVPVLAGGVDGKGVEYIFFQQDLETPKPTISDDSDTEAYQHDDYCPYNTENTQQWTDEPVGVGANSRFEFYAQRKKVDGKWLPFSGVRLWNRYTVDGSTPYIMDLSNEQSFINCSEDGTPLPGATYESSRLMIFKGSSYAFTEFDILVTPTNISCNGKTTMLRLTDTQKEAAQSAGYFTLTPSDIKSDSAQITIQATLKSNTSIVLVSVYKVNKNTAGKGGVVYSLVPSLNVIHRNENGLFTDTTMSVQVNKIGGQSLTEIKTKDDLTAEGLTLTFQGSHDSEQSVSSLSELSTYTLCGTADYTRFFLRRGSTLLDSERINVVKDGKNGNPGDDGNGIESQSSLFVATTNLYGVTYDNTGGWKESFVTPTPALPYVWKVVRTVYTQSGTTYSTAELVATYQSGANPNLLDNTAFVSMDRMSAWDIINSNSPKPGVSVDDDYRSKEILTGTDGFQGRNAFRGGTRYSLASIRYKEVLRQPITEKLRPSTWYTFSYWVKCFQDSLFYNNQTSNIYGFCRHRLYLQSGHRYRIQMKGFISSAASSAGQCLRAFIFKEDWSWQRFVEIRTTYSSEVTLELKDADAVPSTGEYLLCFYSYDEGYLGANPKPTLYNVTVERFYIRDIDFMSVVYTLPSLIDTDIKGFVDNIEQNIPSDGAMYINSSVWTKHTLTFKTKAELPKDSDGNFIEQYVLFRLMPSLVKSRETNNLGEPDVSTTSSGIAYMDICMPKLEEGFIATGYIPEGEDTLGCGLRGPQVWADVPVGFDFQAGGYGDSFQDVVVDDDGDYYYCRKSHRKLETSQRPKYDTQNWKQGSKFDMVATKMFLAQYALVKNLGVETIDMRDANGNILFQAKDGNVICNTGIFRNVRISGFLYKEKTVITQQDLSKYIYNTEWGSYFDFIKAGNWIELKDLTSDFVITLPPLNFADSATDEQRRQAFDAARALVGSTMLIYNRSNVSLSVTGYIRSQEESSSVSVTIAPGRFISLECKMTLGRISQSSIEEHEMIYYIYRTGNIYV